ncbi:receptor like protein kinase S.2 [Amaranthus tricolor]|uniref:receptor like protein kinase S.2 n=1 Tax=Amaranthus tricolor TaxID=29722 RepID=UPI002583CF21|nr:receptor like protein kinase S.2 [Amaranthus tricolor]
MPLSHLCYILPTEPEPDPGPNPKPEMVGEVHGTGIKKRRRMNIHDQILCVLRRSLRHICCKNNTQMEPEEKGMFHDIKGIELGDCVKMESNLPNPKVFTYAELYIGTNGFSPEMVLGSGGFGRVFKAVLPSDGTEVAVKCLLNHNKSSSHDSHPHIDKTFAAELVAVAHLRHRNLVRLRGWCVHESQLLLVYDYMVNRSLDRVLFNSSVNPFLDFQKRAQIVLGLAAALFYLHEQLETQIIHRDVKTSNVMLDSHYNARLGDFGLARWLEHDRIESPSPCHHPSIRTLLSSSRRSSEHDQFRLTETSRIGGTIGYLPPESFQKRYVATAKSDVFSFGIVALEVACGRRAVDLTVPDDKIILLDWVRRLADDGSLLLAADPRLPKKSYQVHDLERLIHLGLLCTVHNPKSRPSVKWVLDALCGNMFGKLPSLPCFRAHPLYISLSSNSSSDSSKHNATPNSTNTTASVSSILTIYITSMGKTVFVTAEGITDSKEASFDTDTDVNATKKDIVPVKYPSYTEVKSSMSVNCSFPIPMVATPRDISYAEIVSATNNFSDSHRVAEVDFGTAYKGFLDDHHHVLVKRLGMKTCPALRTRFLTELQNLGRLRHRNLVQLRGWCMEQGEMLVVYDYLASRLLTHLLFHNTRCKVLQWPHRYSIIAALASAIVYLHEEWDEQVIHRNITSSSIIVDVDMNPRLTSFALAEFLTRNEHGHHVANGNNSVRGIFGYMSPEYMESGEANTAADVYSFGVVVLEMVSGQMAVDFRHPEVLLVKRVREYEATGRPLEGLADPQLGGEYEPQEFVRLLKLGLACTHSDPRLRPSMRQITSILDGNSSCIFQGCMEAIEEWKQANSYSMSLIRRIQALGIH